jgi:hypothetical protein
LGAEAVTQGLLDDGQLAAAAGAAVDDSDPPFDFEDDDESLEDSVEVLDFLFSPFDELLLDAARLSVR